MYGFPIVNRIFPIDAYICVHTYADINMSVYYLHLLQ